MKTIAVLALCAAAAVPVIPALAEAPVTVPMVHLEAGKLAKIGTVSDRFLSYNVEMVEVTGGRFWRPYGSPGADRYEYRPPLDLTDARMRKLARALGPAYVRVSGTWANATYFADTDTPPEKALAGFDTVLTRKQWRGVIDFAKAVDGRIVTSVATSPGTRDAAGVWQPDMARRWFAYTRKIGGSIAATEFANEPNMIWLTQPPAGYTGADYRRDYALFARWLRQAYPGTKLLAPGIAELGEPFRAMSRKSKTNPPLENDEMIEASSPRPDAFSYHYYGGGSVRCGAAMLGMNESKAFDQAWLGGVDAAIARIADLRNRTAPGAPLWNTESGETACGGNPWAQTYLDVFRFVDTLGRSARQGVEVFMHNTLAASDYALLDEGTHLPRPNYWAAVLWKRLAGTVVLDAPKGDDKLNLYAQCLKGSSGGVMLIAVNLDRAAGRTFHLGRAATVYSLTQGAGGEKSVALNGADLKLGRGDALPALGGKANPSGHVTVPAASVSYIAMPGAANPACR